MKLSHLIKERHPIQRGGLWIARHAPGAPGYGASETRATVSSHNTRLPIGIRFQVTVERLAVAAAWTVTIVSFGLAAFVAGELL